MKTYRLIVATLVLLSAGLASAQTPAPGPNGAAPGPGAADSAKAAQQKERNRMQEAIAQDCEKNPNACAERRAKADARHTQPPAKEPVQAK